MENKLDFETFKPLIDKSWWSDLEPFIASETCFNIYKKLKEDSGAKKVIFPKSNVLWRAFKETKKQDLKVVFLGLSPYPTAYNNIPLADGLCFSAENQTKEPPSLKLIYDSLEEDVCNGLNLNMKRELSLKKWANQGVLLLNSALTVEQSKPESHLDLWKPFINYLFENVFNKINGLIIVSFGKEASKFEAKSTPFIHYWKSLEHPAFAARQMRPFKHENLFTWCNKLLRENNGNSFEINWLNERIIHNVKESECPF